MAIQEVRTLKKLSYFDGKKLVHPVNYGRIRYAQAINSPQSPSPNIKEILPVVTQFLERYLSEVYRKPDVQKYSEVKTDMQMVQRDIQGGPLEVRHFGRQKVRAQTS